MPPRPPLAFAALATCLAFLVPQATAAAQHAGHNIAITVPPGAPYTVADVEFMQGMIAHHAQAIHMSRMAEKHGANPRVLRLAIKIDQSQIAEIRLMQEWLVHYGQVAPDTSSWRTMKMAGMLTEAQLAELDSATGVAFDRAFLRLMIQHHEGALQMVKDLFAATRAGQEVDVNVFANDVVTVQTAEIGVMRQMLSQLPPSDVGPLSPTAFPMSIARKLLAFAGALVIPTLLAAQTYPNKEDPRSKLKPGKSDAEVATKNMRLVSNTKKAAVFDTSGGLTFANSDLAFRDKYVYQGNFSGFSIWDVSDPATPKLVSTVQCVTSQGDPTIIGNLLFISAEGGANRNDCAKGGVKEPGEHMAGVRIYDVSNPAEPRLVKNVQTCKGSHTHTALPHPKDKNVLYIYVSGSGGARPATEVAGCKEGTDAADETNSLFRLDVIKVDLRHPEKAEVVTGARIFTGLDPAPRAASRPARGGRGRAPGDTTTPPAPTGPRNCHDVTAYPAAKLLAGACGSYGLLVDVSNPEKPKRLDAKADTNFSLWHTAVFSNDGKKVVFTDEWGGGTSPMCQANSMMEMGGNTILTIDPKRKYQQHAYYKIPSVQTAEENCVSHNGGLIPVPGRDVMVQGWYQGGVSVMDFTDPANPKELAYFDRGAIDAPPQVDVPITAPPAGGRGGRGRSTIGGSWGAYYWNGYIYSSEIDRGFDILELQPGDQLSKNEIEAAKLVRFVEYNPQSQPKIEWPAAFPVVRSYLDQLVRWNGLAAERTTAIASALDAAEQQAGKQRRDALNALAKQVDKDVADAKDSARVKAMSDAIKLLAKATK